MLCRVFFARLCCVDVDVGVHSWGTSERVFFISRFEDGGTRPSTSGVWMPYPDKPTAEKMVRQMLIFYPAQALGPCAGTVALNKLEGSTPQDAECCVLVVVCHLQHYTLLSCDTRIRNIDTPVLRRTA